MIRNLRLKIVLRYALILFSVSVIIFVTGYKVYQMISREMLQDSLRSYMQGEIYEFKQEALLSKIQLNKIKTDSMSLQFFSFRYSGNYLLQAEVPDGKIGEMLSDKVNAIKDFADDFKEIHLWVDGKRWDFLVLSHVWADVLGFQKQVAVTLNITPNIHIMRRYKSYGFIGVFLLCFLSLLLAYKMADSAVKPLVLAYDKQKKFVSDVSHEMKTPLSVLLTYTEILEKKSDKSILTILKSEIKNMSLLVENLLSLMRFEQKNKVKVCEKINAKEIIDERVRRLNEINSERSQKILSITENCQVMVERQHLERLVTILLDNALKYTPSDKKITVSAKNDNGKFILNVKDEGIGISAQDQKHIFERFYRVDAARNRQSGGNGLGLSLAQELVQYYGGKIEVRSQELQGSEFIVILP